MRGIYVDITGQRFGKLLVLKRLPNRKNSLMWLTKCDCGREVVSYGDSLKQGKKKGCGRCKYEDLTGQRFGELVVESIAGTSRSCGHTWRCKCDCGKTKIATRQNLMKGFTRSCGCLRERIKGKTKTVQIGNRFGRLIALEHVGFKNHHPYFKWKCDCGKETTASAISVKSGNTKSCGCLRSETSRILGATNPHPGRDGKQAVRARFKEYATRCRFRAVSFLLSIQEFEALVQSPCSYCGQPPVPSGRKAYGWYAANGIDRLDSSKGYEKSNTCSCCMVCNIAKSTMSVDEFKQWIRRVALHLGVFDEPSTTP